ncbi:hypothetical protein [Runella sp.]|uniref:hypothetical protein n=1 Tax=Runella sp. TaxID=1960881 RepID=UPI003D14423A
MKNTSFFRLLLVVLVIAGCQKKDDAEPLDKLSKIPQNFLNDIKSRGMLIHEGSEPPVIEGIFLLSPDRLLSPYGSDDIYEKGEVITDHKFQFTNQQSNRLTCEDKEVGTGIFNSFDAYVEGSGNLFTLFAEINHKTESVEYTTLEVISGEITATGIKNFQKANVVISKGADPDGDVLDVGEGRIWEDGDGIAGKVSAFRIAAPETASQQAGLRRITAQNAK